MPGIVDDDEQRVCHEDDFLRHYLDDATVLLDDREVRVVADEPDQMEWRQILRRAPRAVPRRER